MPRAFAESGGLPEQIDMRLYSRASLIVVCYAGLLLATDLILPLRIPEILQALAARHFSWGGMIGWIAQTPDSAPLSYFAQLPFLLVWHHGRLAARFPSLVFAVAACIVLLKLFKDVPIRRPEFAIAAFMLLPVHYRSATEARAFEQALFFTVLEILLFLRLIRAPSVTRSVLYGAALTACLYTEPYSFLPAIGQLVFLLRFVNLVHARRVIWFTLPATIAPPLLFMPYYFWAHPQASTNWISRPGPPPALPSLAYVLLALLVIGFFAGLWTTFRSANRSVPKRMFLFCIAGGVLSAVSADQLLWTAPGVILLSFAALDWLSRSRRTRIAGSGLAALLILCCVPIDARYLTTQTEDVQAQAATVSRELTASSCIVFLSEGLSKDLFIFFQPQLASYECLNFFHHRVMLAIHPYVGVSYRKDADSYFRGLGFHETRRFSEGDGEVVILEQGK